MQIGLIILIHNADFNIQYETYLVNVIHVLKDNNITDRNYTRSDYHYQPGIVNIIHSVIN